MRNQTTENGLSLPAKDRIDALLALADARWRDFNTRRSFEWKVTIGLWTAQALFATFVFRTNVKSVSNSQIVFLGAIFAVIIYIYAFRWTKGIWESNEKNKQDARDYWKLADEALGIPSERYERDKTSADSFMSDFSNGSQVSMTVLLAVLDLWCVWVRYHKS